MRLLLGALSLATGLCHHTSLWHLLALAATTRAICHDATVTALTGRLNLATYIEGGLDGQSPQEKGAFDALFASGAAPPELTPAQKAAILKTLDGVSLSSDAFFPFPDNIDVAAKFGVKYIAQAGGSVQDAQVIDAAKGYGMMMAMTGLRLFHH